MNEPFSKQTQQRSNTSSDSFLRSPWFWVLTAATVTAAVFTGGLALLALIPVFAIMTEKQEGIPLFFLCWGMLFGGGRRQTNQPDDNKESFFKKWQQRLRAWWNSPHCFVRNPWFWVLTAATVTAAVFTGGLVLLGLIPCFVVMTEVLLSKEGKPHFDDSGRPIYPPDDKKPPIYKVISSIIRDWLKSPECFLRNPWFWVLTAATVTAAVFTGGLALLALIPVFAMFTEKEEKPHLGRASQPNNKNKLPAKVPSSERSTEETTQQESRNSSEQRAAHRNANSEVTVSAEKRQTPQSQQPVQQINSSLQFFPKPTTHKMNSSLEQKPEVQNTENRRSNLR